MILKNYPNLQIVLNEIGKEIQDEYKQRLKQKNSLGRNSIATGTLYNSVKYELKSVDDSIHLYLNLADHWIRVEYDSNWSEGSNPPPPTKIRAWMSVKKINIGKGGEYKISNSIKRKGIKGKHFLENTIKEFKQSDWKSKITDALNKDIKKLILNNIKETNKKINKKL